MTHERTKKQNASTSTRKHTLACKQTKRSTTGQPPQPQQDSRTTTKPSLRLWLQSRLQTDARTTTMAQPLPLPLVRSEERLTLDVGGVVYVTARTTLTEGRAEGSRLAATFQQPPSDTVSDAIDAATGGHAFFIDRDGDTFAHVMYWLRTGELKSEALADAGVLECIHREATFFHLLQLLEYLGDEPESTGSAAGGGDAPVKRRRAKKRKSGSQLTQQQFMRMYMDAGAHPAMVNNVVYDSHTNRLNTHLASPNVKCFINATGLNLSGLDLSNLDLKGWNLTNANLEGADLSNANLQDTTLAGADLTKAVLKNANLTAANVTNANLTGVDLSGATLLQLQFQGAKLTGANLSGCALHGFIFNGLDLTGTDLSDTNLSKANLSKANLSHTNLQRTTLTGAKLARANLSGCDLHNRDFSNFDLTGTNFNHAKLQGAVFSGAALASASFYYSQLQNATFTNANLTHTDFRGAQGLDRNGPHFSGANTTNTRWQ
ncbi:pentapeptide repeat protein [Salpingoeca rosetta]|uniref:Pentapeptide repeat protein n=1 Tax=Salpingoeca rosetta (strain ATCC 50818 / BSB-021) TaxID=946362 RepID=F2UF34_SALR5|nr:pentapeptide repeat protein [Salpingoeca rosetta]EGD75234.1 pentapeptide repeat protein [Salpingoeca rosetta]|eukprot:XP_004992287.1 pentapeptide repeat protein [Salpingoeca rosetta]